MQVNLVDTHAHLMDPSFDGDRDDVLVRAEEAGVRLMVCPGYDLPTSRAAVVLAERCPRLFAAVGIHPNEAGAADGAAFAEIGRLARTEAVVGIGETGLDYYRDRTPAARQQIALDWHLRLAEELALPVLIHNRQADADLADLLVASAARRTGAEVPGVLHCFTSTDPAYLSSVLDAGYYVSFAGPLTYRKNEELRVMATRVPLDRLLVETDAPYLPPEPFRGRRNEPAHVRRTAERLAGVLGVPFEALAHQLWENSCRVFPALARMPEEISA